MHYDYLTEDDKCPDCGERSLDWVRDGCCSCHINPPCSACTSAKLTCLKCGYVDNPKEYQEKFAGGDPFGTHISERIYKPRPLDATKIDWRSEGHTHFSMIKKGVYPDGVTKEQVEREVKGTFGGRFSSFGNGKFTYIAYTD